MLCCGGCCRLSVVSFLRCFVGLIAGHWSSRSAAGSSQLCELVRRRRPMDERRYSFAASRAP
jgi:hypothetical protein